MMLKQFTKWTDEVKQEVYTYTLEEKPVSLLQRHGFEVYETFEDQKTGLRMWYLHRKPK